MAKELKSLKKRQQSRKQASGKKSKTVAFMTMFLLITMSVDAVVFYVYEKKYAPSREIADKAEYFGVSGDDVALFLNDEQAFQESGEPVTGKMINGGIFIPYEWVMSNLNRGYYWAKDTNKILYTLPTEVKSYGLGDTLDDGSTAFLRVGDSTDDLFLNIKFVSEYTDIRYSTHLEDDTKRVFMFDNWDDYSVATVSRRESVRLLGGIKSEILTNLKAGDKVKILESMENWSKVQTEDGYIGFMRNNRMSKETVVTPESSFDAPEYTHITRSDGSKVVLGFHQVTSTAANEYMESITSGVSGMNVIAPTWFVIDSDEGGFKHYWTQDYVDKAHAKGYQVWATVNNFDAGNIDESVFLKSTELRQALVSNLVAVAAAGGIDGLNIDFELIPESLGRDYVQFMRELSVACRNAGIILSADCYVPYDYNRYYDIEQLGKYIDYVLIMCYDEHYGGGDEGSVASIGYVNRGISEATKAVDKDRVLIAVPFYTRVWITNTAGETSSDAMGISDAMKWAASKGVEFTWDSELGQNFGQIQDGDLVKKVWMEDYQSMQLKVDAVKEADVGGIGAWKLGQEPSDMWPILDLNGR